MSDEARKYVKRRDFLIELPLVASRVRDVIISETIAAYDQGREDAWRWRKYPKEKPTESCEYICEFIAHEEKPRMISLF